MIQIGTSLVLQASFVLDPAFTVADVQRRTFGSFVEHMGRCVYTGIYEPDHPSADSDGHRGDVLGLSRELGVTMIRYPGGNFVSGYRWEDGIGPLERRPRRLDPAWHSLDTNAHGIGEMVKWARKCGLEVNYAVNLGTRGVQEALDVLEYANHPGGTYWSDLRAEHGHRDPFNIRMWCLGNEMDGPWQLGHKTPYEYGRLAAETARAMRQFQPGLELVACGSSGSAMPQFGTWEAIVLDEAYDQVDMVSAHAYYEPESGDLDSFLASAMDMEAVIADVVATVDHIGAKRRSRKRINIAFDEWNVWYQGDMRVPEGEWPEAPRVGEDVIDAVDAVVVGSLLITLLRNSDRVTAACQAQLVNALGIIRTEPAGTAWRQASFFPFAQAARFAKGAVLRLELQGPKYETAKFGTTPLVHAVATHDEASHQLVVFAINRDRENPIELCAGARAFRDYQPIEHLALTGRVGETNTQEHPDRVAPRRQKGPSWDGETFRALLPPVSWNVIRLGRRPA